MNYEFLIISIILIITYIFIRIVFKINIKEIKQLGENKELDELTNKYPTNIEICKEILSKLNNTNVKIEEDKDANSTMYFILGNKIFIGNLKNSYTRIQTIAHECLHSIQDKRLLWTNFIFANVYNIIFVIVCILAITKIIKTKMIFLSILLILGFTYYIIRSYLENDAMIKAKFLAKEYMETSNILNNEQIEKVIEQYDKLNNAGIKCVNVKFFDSVILKCIIYSIICCIII